MKNDAQGILYLSRKAKENLKRNVELRQKYNEFIKLQLDEKKILQFNPEKIEQIEAEFNGKKSIRIRYTVNEVENEYQQKYLEVGKRASKKIDSFLIGGTTKLKVQKVCLGLDTDYHTHNTCV